MTEENNDQVPQPEQPAAQQPQFEQPAAQPAPPAGGYQQPAPVPASDPVANIQLNYWLSVFLGIIPALIFWLIEKDKGDQRATALHVSNMNFAILRLIVSLVWPIPVIGWIIGGLGGLVLFIFHLIAATKAADAYRTGQADPFIFNIPLIK